MAMMRHERRELGTMPVDAPARVSVPSYEIEIDEFILTGFSGSEGQVIAESVRETLGQLFADDATRWSRSESMQVDALDAGNVQVRQSGHAQSTGEQIARVIYGSLPR